MQMFLMRLLLATFVLICLTCPNVSDRSFAESDDKTEDERQPAAFTLPENVFSIEKENTHANHLEEIETIEPSKETKELIDVLSIHINNPELIKLLNETAIRPSPLAIGYRATIYLGRWPLSYKSEKSEVISDYQKVNENNLDNRDGDVVQEIKYNQQAKKEITGALANKIDQATVIRKMMIQEAANKTKLPLSFTAVIGQNTKLNHFYHVKEKKAGYLHAYCPAIHEQGEITFGEVYIELKGNTKKLHVKNVTKQAIGAWIPIQDHVALQFEVK